MHDAVNPKADTKPTLGRFNVDVRCSLVQSLEDQEIHITDNRGILDDRLEVVELQAGVVALTECLTRRHVCRRAATTVDSSNEQGELRTCGHDRLEVSTEYG